MSFRLVNYEQSYGGNASVSQTWTMAGISLDVKARDFVGNFILFQAAIEFRIPVNILQSYY